MCTPCVTCAQDLSGFVTRADTRGALGSACAHLRTALLFIIILGKPIINRSAQVVIHNTVLDQTGYYARFSALLYNTTNPNLLEVLLRHFESDTLIQNHECFSSGSFQLYFSAFQPGNVCSIIRPSYSGYVIGDAQETLQTPARTGLSAHYDE